MESDNGSETGPDTVGDVSPDKLDPTDRDLYEKLKKQEKEERLEIERELKAHEDALSKRHDELRLRDFRMHEKLIEQERGQDLRVNKSENKERSHERELREKEEYRVLRETALREFAAPRLDILNHPAYLAAAAAAAGYPQSHSPESVTSQSPLSGEGPAHHWTFEEQFKQVGVIIYLSMSIYYIYV